MSKQEHNEEQQPEVETLDGEHPAFDATVGDDPAAGEVAEESSEPTIEEQLAAEKDRVLRLQAELQNTLARKQRELAEQRRYAGLALMKDILPVLDNIDRAIEAAEKAAGEGEGESAAADASGLLDGFKLVRQQMVTVLGQHNCEPIAAEGEPFNPDLHEAILQQPSPDHQAGTVLMQTQCGYKLHERVVRPSQVIVSSGEGA